MEDTNLSLEEFYELCSNELHFLVEEYGFQEIRADTLEGKYINPYKLIFVRDGLRIEMEGINWGQHAMLSITRNNRIMGIRSLCPSVISAPKKPKNYISRAASQTDDIKRHSYELREYGKDLLNGDFSFFDKVSFQKQVNSAESRKISAISKALAAYRTEEWQTIVDLLESDEAELPEGMLKILNIARDKVQQTTGVRKFLSSLFGKR